LLTFVYGLRFVQLCRWQPFGVFWVKNVATLAKEAHSFKSAAYL
jgi:hypothetical protein